MGGDGLGLTSLADHEELGQDGHRLQVDGERPQNLSRTKTTQCWWKNNRTWMSREAIEFKDICTLGLAIFC